MTAAKVLAAILAFHDDLPYYTRQIDQFVFPIQLFLVGVYVGVIVCLCLNGRFPSDQDMKEWFQ